MSGEKSKRERRGRATVRQARGAILLFSLLFFWGALGSHSLRAAEESAYYPGKLGIQKGKKLTPEEREVEARFAKYLEEHTDEAVALYREKYGNEIDTDNARELSKDYAPGGMDAEDAKTRAARTRWSAAVHEPSSALTKEIYRRELKKSAGPKQLSRVVFTAGGAGAGKTTSINQFSSLAHAVEAAQIVVDTTLSSFKSSVDRIAQALDAGKTVSIVYVYRDPVVSLVGGALPRAERSGRTLPLEAFLDTHIGAPEVLLKVAEMYKGDKRVEIAVIDNSRGKGEATVSDLKFVQKIATKYTRDGLREKLERALEDTYEKGKRGEKDGISEAVYRAFKGHDS